MISCNILYDLVVSRIILQYLAGSCVKGSNAEKSRNILLKSFAILPCLMYHILQSWFYTNFEDNIWQYLIKSCKSRIHTLQHFVVACNML